MSNRIITISRGLVSVVPGIEKRVALSCSFH